jgi:hypothetical protein
MPGYRERLIGACLASLPTGEHLQWSRDCLGGTVLASNSPWTPVCPGTRLRGRDERLAQAVAAANHGADG